MDPLHNIGDRFTYDDLRLDNHGGQIRLVRILQALDISDEV
jgi:hypothetical protein